MRFVVGKSPSEALALTNCLIINTGDLKTLGHNYCVVNGKYLFNLRGEDSVLKGTAGFSSTQRRWLQLALNDEVEIVSFDPFSTTLNCIIETLRLEVDVLKKNAQTVASFDSDRMAEIFLRIFDKHIMSIGEPLVMDVGGMNLSITVIGMTHGASQSKQVPQWGIYIGASTQIQFSPAPESLVKLSGEHAINTNAVIKTDFKFEDLGVGGLSKEFFAILRRAFLSRIYPSDVAAKLGMRHVKGLILHGPPGTGKTLIARQIGKMLNTREPKIVNGPEILNKYVGQSEENIRNLFRDAELEYKSKGDGSQLHIIIFDEFDAICRQRNSRNDGTGVGDQVVNQLLSKMDGVEQLNNVLLIGMTNRLDLLDDAILRPGRFEIQLEISLPTQDGRKEILMIHTKSMRENGLLAEDVSLDEISALARNFTGAELVGLLNSAVSYAMSRHVVFGTSVEIKKDAKDVKVMREDFIKAFNEVHAAYGADDEELQQSGANGVVMYSSEIKSLLEQVALLLKRTEDSNKTILSNILIYGSKGSGKTSLAAKLAMESNFPFVRLLSTFSLIGFSEAARVDTIKKLFLDAYKSPLSLIVIDDLEELIEYVGVGPRFNLAILQTLKTFLSRSPPKGHRLVILVTSSNKAVFDQLGLSPCFPTRLLIPNITSVSDFDAMLKRNQNLLPEHQLKILEHVEHLSSASRSSSFSIPVKFLQDLLEIAAQDFEDPVARFIDEFQPYTQSGSFFATTPNY